MKKDRFWETAVSKSPEAVVGNGRFRRESSFLVFLLLLLCGVASGPILSACCGLFEAQDVAPLFFSGIPAAGTSFFSCFSTFLLNQLIFLTVLFLLGVTAFGAFAVPLVVFFKGMTVGLGVSSFLWKDGFRGLGESALTYTPVSAAGLLVFLLFALQAMAFSSRLRKVSFSASKESLDFWNYWKTFLGSLCFAVAASLLGSALSELGLALFS